MILHEAQTENLLGDSRQAETLQANQASGNLSVEESRGAKSHLAKIRQVLQAIMQKPDVFHARLKHGDIWKSMRINEERTHVLTSNLDEVGVCAVAETLSALNIDGDRGRPDAQCPGRRLKILPSVNDGRGPPTRLRNKLRIIRIALRQAAAIVDQHSDSFEMTGRHNSCRPTHHIRPSGQMLTKILTVRRP